MVAIDSIFVGKDHMYLPLERILFEPGNTAMNSKVFLPNI